MVPHDACPHRRLSGCLSLSLCCDVTHVTQTMSLFFTTSVPQPSVSQLVCCVVAPLVAGADLPQCELYGQRGRASPYPLVTSIFGPISGSCCRGGDTVKMTNVDQ